jgi:hypothetical protein
VVCIAHRGWNSSLTSIQSPTRLDITEKSMTEFLILIQKCNNMLNDFHPHRALSYDKQLKYKASTHVTAMRTSMTTDLRWCINVFILSVFLFCKRWQTTLDIFALEVTYLYLASRLSKKLGMWATSSYTVVAVAVWDGKKMTHCNEGSVITHTHPTAVTSVSAAVFDLSCSRISPPPPPHIISLHLCTSKIVGV